MTQRSGEFIPTRATLLSRLKDWEDEESWRRFFDIYWKLIYGVALKSGLSHQQAQDVVQETVVSVARNIGKFKYDPATCSFKSWLLRVTRSRILNHLRREKRHEGKLAETDNASDALALDRIADPAGHRLEAMWEAEWAKNLMDAAISRVKQQVDSGHYQIFDLYVFKRWPVKRIAQTLGVSSAQVYLTKHRVAKLIRKEIAALESEPF